MKSPTLPCHDSAEEHGGDGVIAPWGVQVSTLGLFTGVLSSVVVLYTPCESARLVIVASVHARTWIGRGPISTGGRGTLANELCKYEGVRTKE